MTSTILVDWQTAIIAHLAANLRAGSFTIKPGRRDGPVSRNRKLGCVFLEDAPPDSNVSFIRPVLKVRVWLPKPKLPQTETPKDTTELTQLQEDLLATLQPVQALPAVGGGKGIYAFVTGSRLDDADWGVETTLTGWALNPAVLA